MRDLGVVFDQYLTFMIILVVFASLLIFTCVAQLVHTLITTLLDFCNSILYNLPNNKIERLQHIQNQAAHILRRIPRRNHITPVLRVALAKNL